MNKSDLIRIINEEINYTLDEAESTTVNEVVDPIYNSNFPEIVAGMIAVGIAVKQIAKFLAHKGLNRDQIKKLIKGENNELNESIKYDTSTINDKKYTSTWAGKTDNIEEFIDLINRIPETLESIKVTKETKAFNPASEKFDGPITDDEKSAIIKIVQDVNEKFKENGQEIHTFELSSYYGVPMNAEKDRKAPAYIQYRTKQSDDFGKKMSSGKYGSLD